MITSDMPNTNNANAQLFHWSPNAVNSESFRGSTLETLRQGMMAPSHQIWNRRQPKPSLLE